MKSKTPICESKRFEAYSSHLREDVVRMEDAQEIELLLHETVDALNRLNTIYRSEYDEPGENPPWLREPLRKYDHLMQGLK